MTSVTTRAPWHDDAHETTEVIEYVAEDWLGLAGYLAEVVAVGDLTPDDAGAELGANVTGATDQRALARAVEIATTRFGADAIVTTLIRAAARQAAAAEAAA